VVERLKEAIAKARQARAGEAGTSVALEPSAPANPSWSEIDIVPYDMRVAVRSRIVSAQRSNATNAPFDILRTRVLRALQDNGCKSFAVTSPSKRCGKSVVSLNLAFSISRNANLRTLLVEIDMRAPSITRYLGLSPDRTVHDLLTGAAAPEKACLRVSENLAICAGGSPVRDSAELLLAPSTAKVLERMKARLAPDIVIYDLPPMFGCDDALAFLPNAESVLLVAAAGDSTAEDIAECERQIGESSTLLGIVMNKVDSHDVDGQSAGYGYEAVSA
jgi:Mrp family chromosome partitioning ATPase